jgi:hypothetical protein
MDRRSFTSKVVKAAKADGLTAAQRKDATLRALRLWDAATPEERAEFARRLARGAGP